MHFRRNVAGQSTCVQLKAFILPTLISARTPPLPNALIAVGRLLTTFTVPLLPLHPLKKDEEFNWQRTQALLKINDTIYTVYFIAWVYVQHYRVRGLTLQTRQRWTTPRP